MSKLLGYEALAVSTVAVAPALTPLTTTQLKQELGFVIFKVETNSIRYRGDGTAPTSSVGTLMADGVARRYEDPGSVLNGGLKFIRVTADATVHIEYYA